jgi:hypothetical protein
LPLDSVLLDGSASSDLDGTIVEWRWSKIGGPVTLNLRNPNSSQTIANSLIQGVYQFELRVTDNTGLSDRDTISISVDNSSPTNRPPVANAGTDQTFILPSNSAQLDGSLSSDPDNNISTYLWTKISGPSSFVISNSNLVQAQLTSLLDGVYQFELKVTDAGGFFDTDTINITIVPGCIAAGTRPIINAQLLPIGTLSQAREGIASGFAANKIVFAGGQSPAESGAVDIYDPSNNQWTVSQLSVPRSAIGVTTSGNNIFFAGGGYLYEEIFHSNIDVFDAINNSWSVLNLSNDRTNVTAVSVGDKVMFAGGWQLANTTVIPTSTLNVYNTSSSNWSLTNLPAAGAGIPAVTINDNVYFGVESKIQIYNNNNNSWSQWDLNYLTNPWTVSTVGNKTYWAGAGCTVEIKDITTGNSIAGTLSRPDVYKTVTKDGKVIFFHSGEYQATTFDIYDPVANTWSIGSLSNGYLPAASAIISVNNEIYVAGGAIDCISSSPGSCTLVYTNQVWKLIF